MRNDHRFMIVAGLLATVCAGLPSARAATAPPPFAAYLYRTPTVLGAVTSANDHSVTLQTEAGDRMSFVVDSRSVVPATLANGTQVRVEFVALGADAFHAQRITPLTAGELREMEQQGGSRMRAAAEPEAGSPTAASDSESGTSATEAPTAATTTPAAESQPTIAGEQPSAAAAPSSEAGVTHPAATTPAAAPQASTAKSSTSKGADADDQGLDQLPRTASPLPLIGLLGLLSLGAAAGLRVLRRRRAASSDVA